MTMGRMLILAGMVVVLCDMFALFWLFALMPRDVPQWMFYPLPVGFSLALLGVAIQSIWNRP